MYYYPFGSISNFLKEYCRKGIVSVNYAINIMLRESWKFYVNLKGSGTLC